MFFRKISCRLFLKVFDILLRPNNFRQRFKSFFLCFCCSCTTFLFIWAIKVFYSLYFTCSLNIFFLFSRHFSFIFSYSYTLFFPVPQLNVIFPYILNFFYSYLIQTTCRFFPVPSYKRDCISIFHKLYDFFYCFWLLIYFFCY